LYLRLDRLDLAQGELLRLLGGEAGVAAEDDVDDVRKVLITLCLRLVPLVVLLVLLLFVLIGKRLVQGLAEADALEKGVLGLWVHRALLVHRAFPSTWRASCRCFIAKPTEGYL
jgi:hypothetical protein